MKNNEFKDQTLEVIRLALKEREREILSPIATLSDHGVRRYSDVRLEKGYRQAFSIDVDRILHSRAYTRYIDKTQVFYLIHHDHITHRVLHVQLASKIARTIGRYLGLNEDLIEAIVQFLDKVELKGRGWNLCLQTLDGILCHDGEIHNQVLKPDRGKTFETIEKEMVTKKKHPEIQLIPMTLEGCVVRMSDTISYIGRDIEDAIRLNMIKRADLPKDCVDVLGNTNGTIVHRLVTDIIRNSFRESYVTFSLEVSEALKKLKEFNLEHIYMNPNIKVHRDTIKKLFGILFEKYLEDIETNNRSSVIFKGFLEDMSDDYVHRHTKEEIVRDFIAGMTDQYFLRQCPQDLRPQP